MQNKTPLTCPLCVFFKYSELLKGVINKAFTEKKIKILEHYSMNRKMYAIPTMQRTVII